MNHRLNRRQLLKTSAVIGAGYWIGASSSSRAASSPNEKLNVACIGVGGQGASNVRGVSGENIVALCDVDEERAAKSYQQHPNVRKYHDFRRMLDELDKQIDAVTVSTPDHTHFHAAMAAMQRGKHIYCEKPMAHSVWEARQMTQLAAEKGLATQLGVQRHVNDNIHRVVEIIRSGAIGQILDVHSWVGGSRGMPEIPTQFPPVPSHVKWDLWLGPAKYRPYHPTYCPYGWRFWWDFGTGEMGNWGCHILDIPFWALDLKHPTSVSASGPPVHSQTSPKSMETHFQFPAEGNRPALSLHWYHAQDGPEVLRELGLPKSGNNLFVGTEGMLLCDFGKRKLYPEEKFADFKEPEKTIPDSPGFHNEWITACKGGEAATCNFDYTGPMTETVLLGNAAYRAQGGFNWDAQDLKAIGNDAAEQFIRPTFREGWTV